MACAQLVLSPVLEEGLHFGRIRKARRRISGSLRRIHTLSTEDIPLVQNCELPSITPDVLENLLNEGSARGFDIVIFDCRFEYEHDGGHIAGALHTCNPNSVETFYKNHENNGSKMVIIFHCEFSSQRAPKMFRHMRNLDRKNHLKSYPELSFPHMYILQGGYKAFFENCPDLCIPRAYVKMTDPRYTQEARSSTTSLKRSWSADSNDRVRISSPEFCLTKADADDRSGRVLRCRTVTQRFLDME